MKTLKYSILILLVFLCIPPTATSDLYRWTDENGVKHFSNKPPPEGVDYTVGEEVQTDPAEIKRIEREKFIREALKDIRKSKRELQKQLQDEENSAKKAQADQVYLALHRISSAVNSGVSWIRYSNLVSDARHEIKLANAIRARTELLTDTLECYQDVKNLWNMLHTGADEEEAYDIMKAIGKKYHIDTTNSYYFRGMTDEPFKWKASIEYARPLIWNVCRERLSRYRYIP